MGNKKKVFEISLPNDRRTFDEIVASLFTVETIDNITKISGPIEPGQNFEDLECVKIKRLLEKRFYKFGVLHNDEDEPKIIR